MCIDALAFDSKGYTYTFYCPVFKLSLTFIIYQPYMHLILEISYLSFQIIKVFYAKVYLARGGDETVYKRIDGDNRLYYVDAREDANANQTVVDVVLLGNSTVKPPTTTVLLVTGNATGASDNATGMLKKSLS